MKITFSFLILFSNVIAHTAFAQNESPCSPYLEKLEGIETPSTNVATCSELELVVVRSTDWPQFVRNFSTDFVDSSYPTFIDKALRAEFQAENTDAFVYLDEAIGLMTQIFSRLPDRQRGDFYTSMAKIWRNSQLPKLGASERLVEQINDRYDYAYESIIRSRDASPSRILMCAIRYDALTVSLSDVLSSRAFNDCLGD